MICTECSRPMKWYHRRVEARAYLDEQRVAREMIHWRCLDSFIGRCSAQGLRVPDPRVDIESLIGDQPPPLPACASCSREIRVLPEMLGRWHAMGHPTEIGQFLDTRNWR